MLTNVARMLAQAIARTSMHETELQLSAGLQRTMRPATRPGIAGMALAARYVPSGGGLEVGGDWYDVIPLPSAARPGHRRRAGARRAGRGHHGAASHRPARLRGRGPPPGRRPRPHLPLPGRDGAPGAEGRERGRRGVRRRQPLRHLPLHGGRPGHRHPRHRPRRPPGSGSVAGRRDHADPPHRGGSAAGHRARHGVPDYAAGAGAGRDASGLHGRADRGGRPHPGLGVAAHPEDLGGADRGCACAGGPGAVHGRPRPSRAHPALGRGGGPPHGPARGRHGSPAGRPRPDLRRRTGRRGHRRRAAYDPERRAGGAGPDRRGPAPASGDALRLGQRGPDRRRGASNTGLLPLPRLQLVVLLSPPAAVAARSG